MTHKSQITTSASRSVTALPSKTYSIHW